MNSIGSDGLPAGVTVCWSERCGLPAAERCSPLIKSTDRAQTRRNTRRSTPTREWRFQKSHRRNELRWFSLLW